MIVIDTRTRLVVFPDREYRTTFKPDEDGGYFVVWSRVAGALNTEDIVRDPNSGYKFQGYWLPKGLDEKTKQDIYQRYVLKPIIYA